MDLHLLDASADMTERAAVDALLGPPDSGWEGGNRTLEDRHVARAGYRQAQARRERLLPALHAVQGAVGWVSPGALNYVCERLIVPPAEAYAVATFYALLSTTERPRRVAHVCDDLACRQTGSGELLAGLGNRDDVVASPCLGLCDLAPAAFFQLAGDDDSAAGGADAALVRAGLADTAGWRPPPATGRVGGDATLPLLGRVGRVDPVSFEAYVDAGGTAALQRAIELGPAGVIAEVKASGLRGRGGAAFPTGVKWEAVANAPASPRYVVCNADESEPGTFKDRVLMEGDPFAVVESMTIAGLAVGAELGYLYIRGEYPLAQARLEEAIVVARREGMLGGDLLGSGLDFDIEVRRGAGAYICGEETALFNSIEGYRGEPRNKPPFPTEAGLFGMPTVVNNVETLVNILEVVTAGGPAYAARGTGESSGTKLFCLSGRVGRPGVYEVVFGATLGDLLEMAGGVTGDLRAILLGGAAGSFVGPEMLDLPLTFEDTRRAGVSLGSGVVMPFTADDDLPGAVHRIAAFFRDESCGQCVPCRVGTVRLEEALHRMHGASTPPVDGDLALLDDISQVLRDASICGLGQMAANAVDSAVRLGLLDGTRGEIR